MSAKKISVALGLGVALICLAWTLLSRHKAGWSSRTVRAFQVVYDNDATTYQLQWQNTSSGSSPSSGKQMSTRVSGIMIEEILRYSDGREAVVLRFESPITRMGEPGATANAHLPLKQGLEKGTTFIRKIDGSMESVSQPKRDIEWSAVGILAEIFAMTQRDHSEADKEWTAVEQDLFGKYRVSYAYDASTQSLRKFNKIYDPQLNASKVDIQDPLFSADQKAEVKLEMNFEGIYPKSLIFRSAQGSLNTKLRVAEQLILESSTRLTIHSLTDHPVSAQTDLTQLTNEQVAIDSFAQNALKITEPLVTEDEINKGLVVFKDHKDVRDETDFVLKLRSFLRQNPEKAGAMIQLLDMYSVDSAEYLAVLRAIVASQVPQAQTGLLTFIENKVAGGGPHIMIVAHLAEFERPGPELIDALKKYGESSNEELRSTALLALGTAGAQIGKFDSEQARNVFQDLKSRLESNQDLNEKSTLWGALGNYAGPEVWPLVQAEYPRSAVELRHRLVNALRLVSGDGPLGFLLDKASRGENEAIRLSSVAALSLHTPQEQIIQNVAMSLFKEPSANVQSMILSYLTQNKDKFPQAGEKINEFLKKFPNSEAGKAYVEQRIKSP